MKQFSCFYARAGELKAHGLDNDEGWFYQMGANDQAIFIGPFPSLEALQESLNTPAATEQWEAIDAGQEHPEQ